MKLDGKVLMAVAMMLGATATAGCKNASEAPSKPEITPVVLTPEDPAAPSAAPAASSDAPAASAAAPAANGKTPSISDKLTMVARQPASPASRAERPGRTPSVRAPALPPPVIYEDPGYAPSDEYVYAPGYRRSSGREYVWVYGRRAPRASEVPRLHAHGRPAHHPRPVHVIPRAPAVSHMPHRGRG